MRDPDEYPEEEPYPADSNGRHIMSGQVAKYGGVDDQMCQVLSIEWDDEGCAIRIRHSDGEEETLTSAHLTRAHGDPCIEFGDLELV